MGPGTVTATVSGEAQITAEAETEYPFDETIRLTIRTAQPVEFPLYLRIPSWAADASLKIGGEHFSPSAGTFHKVTRHWSNGDSLMLTLPMSIQFEPRPNGAIPVNRGALLFALKVGEEFRHLRGELPHADWEVHPTTPWNYGLPIDLLTENSLPDSFSITRTPISSTPFAPDTAPIHIEAPAHRVPQWTMHNNSAAPPPAGPITISDPPETIELIPYCCTNLRIAEFPLVSTEPRPQR